MKKLITLALLVVMAAPGALAQTKKRSSGAPKAAKTINMNQQFDSLGDNQEIIEKARALQPSNTMRIVQKREVDRNWRSELGLNYAYVGGGDSYLQTQSYGANLDLHINPNWSVGLRYNDHKSDFTTEGKRVFQDAADKIANGQTGFRVPDVDSPDRSYFAVVNWYPIYGKISWLQSAVSQFDFYVLAGAGQMETTKITSNLYTGGAGMGIWWNRYFSSRIEVRYENYKDFVYTGERNVNGIVAQVGIGFML